MTAHMTHTSHSTFLFIVAVVSFFFSFYIFFRKDMKRRFSGILTWILLYILPKCKIYIYYNIYFPPFAWILQAIHDIHWELNPFASSLTLHNVQ